MGAIYLIRHGQASFGKANYDKLSDVGIEQARALGQALRARVPEVHAVITGTMTRHRETAEGCLSTLRVSTISRVVPGFNEFDHEQVIQRYEPRYENRLLLMADMVKTLNPRRAFQEMFAAATERWMSGQHDADYAESWPAFRSRCVTSLEELRSALGRSKTALVFTSGGVIASICQHLLQVPDAHAFKLNWTLANCGITKVIYSDRGLYLSSLNDHGHFEGQNSKLITYR